MTESFSILISFPYERGFRQLLISWWIPQFSHKLQSELQTPVGLQYPQQLEQHIHFPWHISQQIKGLFHSPTNLLKAETTGFQSCTSCLVVELRKIKNTYTETWFSVLCLSYASVKSLDKMPAPPGVERADFTFCRYACTS